MLVGFAPDGAGVISSWRVYKHFAPTGAKSKTLRMSGLSVSGEDENRMVFTERRNSSRHQRAQPKARSLVGFKEAFRLEAKSFRTSSGGVENKSVAYYMTLGKTGFRALAQQPEVTDSEKGGGIRIPPPFGYAVDAFLLRQLRRKYRAIELR